MAKTDLTISIEKKLMLKFYNTSTRFALEVPIGAHGGSEIMFGVADFVTVDIKNSPFPNQIPFIKCYEIKVSVADFKSKNGHNFYGDENYYIVSEEVWQAVLDEKIDIQYGVGVYLYKGGALYLKRKCVWDPKVLTFDDRMILLDAVMVKWESGTMYREMPVIWRNFKRIQNERKD